MFFSLRYNWFLTAERLHDKHNCTGPYGNHQFVPMVRGLSSWDDKITDQNLPPSVKYILGFNEPDHAHASNITPEVAAQHWKSDIEPHAAGKILVSPAVTSIHWLAQFFHFCTGCRVDHIAVHKYDCNAANVMDFLRRVWQRFRRPIWLTEFSCPHSTDPNEQLQLMKELLPQLEAAPFVYRYAWFATRTLKSGWVTPAVNLLHTDSPTLTTIGQFYNNFGT